MIREPTELELNTTGQNVTPNLESKGSKEGVTPIHGMGGDII